MQCYAQVILIMCMQCTRSAHARHMQERGEDIDLPHVCTYYGYTHYGYTCYGHTYRGYSYTYYGDLGLPRFSEVDALLGAAAHPVGRVSHSYAAVDELDEQRLVSKVAR
jgi:hypothetical protein